MKRELPFGIVTFLFTDIEGSTKLWQQFPDAMPAALARHHALLRYAIEAHDGYVFQIIGDAFCAAFANAIDALESALDAQRALRDEAWTETGEIRVRMALHTGAAEVRTGEFTSGEYISGITLSRAARLLSAGHGGQILLSHPVYELVQDHLPRELVLRDMGSRRLKDLIRPEHLFQVVTPDLPADFAPLKTLDARPNNLPVQLTSFIGRAREIAAVKHQLVPPSPNQNGVRLLTLTGAGGSGKTRLSLQVGADLIDDFDHGVWLVELAPISDPALIPQAVAAALGVQEQPPRPLLDTLLEFLKTKHLLLILDNCEHLIEACAQFAMTLLTQCPDIRILASSREGLGITGETLYPVPTLSVPEKNETPTPGSLEQYEAVRLFIDRARAMQKDFIVTNVNARAVAQICYRLDGIPLAIELAAARVKSLGVEQIAARLDDRFRLLTGGSRTALPRQRTLQAAIDWSYKLLSEPERVLLQRLSVFSGGWTVEAAESVGSSQVAGGSHERVPPTAYCLLPAEILDLLSLLVDKSLVVAETEMADPRYHLLETIRQYAQEKLDEAGDGALVRDRHLEWFRQYAERAEPELRSSEQLVRLDRLDKEYDNLRAALQWAAEQESASAILNEARLAVALWRFWLIRSNFSEAHHWLDHALTRTERVFKESPTPATGRVYVQVLNAAGAASDWQDVRVTAYAHLEKSIRLCQEMGDRANLAEALVFLSHVIMADVFENSQSVHSLTEARALAQQGVEVSRGVGDKWGLAQALFALGRAERDLNHLQQAREHYESSLELLTELGDRWFQALPLSHLGFIAIKQGDYAAARPYFEQRLEIGRQLQSKQFEIFSLQILGDITMESKEYQEASNYYKQSLEIASESSRTFDSLLCLANLAHLAAAQGQTRKATRLAAAVETHRQKLGWQIGAENETEYEQFIKTLSAQIDDRLFETLWAEGRALTLAQAIELALNDTGGES